MAPKRKLICDLGSVQWRSGQWIAAAWLDGKTVYGPTRYQESAAQADLQLARTASSKTEMAALLHQLKKGVSSEREHDAHEMQELEKSRVDDAKATEELKAKNDRLEIQIRALLETNANQQLEISGLRHQIGALQETNANQQLEISGLKHQIGALQEANANQQLHSGGFENQRKKFKTELTQERTYSAELEANLAAGDEAALPKANGVETELSLAMTGIPRFGREPRAGERILIMHAE